MRNISRIQVFWQFVDVS